jgi:hypothetical protein
MRLRQWQAVQILLSQTNRMTDEERATEAANDWFLLSRNWIGFDLPQYARGRLREIILDAIKQQDKTKAQQPDIEIAKEAAHTIWFNGQDEGEGAMTILDAIKKAHYAKAQRHLLDINHPLASTLGKAS